MMRTNRAIGSALAGALACAAIAGLASAQDAAQLLGQSANGMSGVKDASSLISSWPAKTRTAAEALIQKYGLPNGMTDRMLVWNDKGQWKEIAVYRDPVKHGKPMPHEDFVQNTVSYTVPEGKVADLIKFDHSLVIDVTRGTLASHCDSEAANTLALNLADEIVTGKRSVASAKDFLKSTLMKSMAGKASPYEEKLMFSTSPMPKKHMPGMPGTEPMIEKNAQPPAPPATGY
jgi:hypothetical protein